MNIATIKVRPSHERGHADHGWLNTYHTFSFADYFDQAQMGFRSLRVINEDRVAPGEGFGSHPHKDMEIITIVLEGELAHKDSMGNASVIRPGDVQKMTAGTGIVHSEFNNSKDQWVHLFQIWIHPSQKGLKPSHEQISYVEQKDQLTLVASTRGENNSIKVAQDIKIYKGDLSQNKKLSYTLIPKRGLWVQIEKGQLQINDVVLKQGDGAALENVPLISLLAKEDCRFLLFDVI